MSTSQAKQLAFVLYPGLTPLDVIGPLQTLRRFRASTRPSKSRSSRRPGTPFPRTRSSGSHPRIPSTSCRRRSSSSSLAAENRHCKRAVTSRRRGLREVDPAGLGVRTRAPIWADRLGPGSRRPSATNLAWTAGRRRRRAPVPQPLEAKRDVASGEVGILVPALAARADQRRDRVRRPNRSYGDRWPDVVVSGSSRRRRRPPRCLSGVVRRGRRSGHRLRQRCGLHR